MKKPTIPQIPALPKLDLKELSGDFRNLDPKDIGAWPLAPRVLVLAVLFVALIALGWWFDWRAQGEQLDARRLDEARFKEEFLGKKKQAVNLEEYRRQLAEIDRTFGALLKQLPNKSEMEALLVDINQAGLGRGLQFDLFRPGAEAVKDFYAEMPIAVKVSGGYHDLGAFAGDVVKLPRIVSLRDVQVSVAQPGTLTMDATATTYRYLDENEVAEQRKQKQAAKK